MDAAQEAPVKKLRMTIRKQLEIAQAEKAALETTLRDTTSALQESIGREQQVCRTLETRVGRLVGEHPVEYSKRVAARIDELFKNNSDLAVAREKDRQESLRIQQGQKSEIQLLNGQLNSLEGVLTGAVQMAKAGKPPAPPDVLVDPRLSDKMERPAHRRALAHRA